MNREQARKWFQSHMTNDPMVNEAFNMAIEALTEPKTIIGIDIPYGSDKGIATIFKGNEKMVLEEVKEIMAVVRCKDCKWYDNRDVCHNPRYGDGHANYSPPDDEHQECWEITTLKALPSADATVTVIRAKTFMRKEDFNKWADDIKKQNKSIVCIPCDAEVVSADSVVRCKDCRYFKKIAERSDSGLCHRDIVASAWKENGYCSRGERND